MPEAAAGIDWDALANVIDVFSSEEYTPILHQFYPWMVEQLDARDLEPSTFVDVGCGTALLSEKLLDWYPDAELVLIDGSPSMLARARERMAGESGVRLIEAEAMRGLEGLEPGSVDALVFCRSFYALADPAKVAARSVELLSPDGVVFFYDFTRVYDLAPLDEFYGELEPERWPVCRALTVDFLEGIAEGRYRVYAEAELTALWGSAGAELVAYETHEPDFPQHQACLARADGR
jgi:ubiquinone/menaquinone biosynthesis C-methylase UbiE